MKCVLEGHPEVEKGTLILQGVSGGKFSQTPTRWVRVVVCTEAGVVKIYVQLEELKRAVELV